jgi:23S rRNA (uridine2552-2'-O)-methyltransferase
VPNEWLRQRKRDQFHRLAKERGFRSRASFKLLQIVKRYQFLRSGDHVLDLGAAPGGWLQAARQVVGNSGYVLGVDRDLIQPLYYKNVATIVADITEPNITDRIRSNVMERFDVLISDLAPNVSGTWELDHARQIDLARTALKIARELLKPSGNMLVKVFQGSEYKEFELEMRDDFDLLRIVKPPASRPESAELYLLGLRFRKRPRNGGDL